MPFLNDPSLIAEDDRLRSSYMRELVREAASADASSGRVRIPRVMVQYWHDSGAVPDDVRECLASWEPLTGQGFERILFDDNTARGFIASQFGRTEVAAFDRCPHPAMRCDYFRLCYIFRHGGFYVDADEVYQGGDLRSWFGDGKLKIQPLCYSTLSNTMVPTNAFVGNRACSPEWIFYVNNNPLIAPASHPVIRLALARATRILLSHTGGRLDIQSATGPGNLTSSLVRHSIAHKLAGKTRDFLLLTSWDTVSVSRWPLSYRHDERNWRLWSPRV